MPIIQVEDPNSPDACMLMDELSLRLAEITGDSGKASFDSNDVCASNARFLLARDAQGVALGCGALRPLPAGVAENVVEIKRMYARPGTRGVGSAILSMLEFEARGLGYATIWLETRLVNRVALAFYEQRGYRRIANYGKYAGNPLAVCFEKRLRA